MTEKKIPSWNELIALLNSADEHPSDTAWSIYRYLNANYKEMTSVEARTLLASYFKIPLPKPSLLHSCILGVALKMSEVFADFNLLKFLVHWGYDVHLRPEDRMQQAGKDGKTYISLEDKTERSVRKYLTEHPAECPLRPVKELPMIEKPVIGYVNSYDANNDYFHVFDNMSRHFVAMSPKVTPDIGGFVWFTPIIPRSSRFKSAVIIKREDGQNAREVFGMVDAEVTFVNRKEGYLGYKLVSMPPVTNEGVYSNEGTVSLKCLKVSGNNKMAASNIQKGQRMRLVLFLTRGKDAQKHNHVAEAVVL